MKEIERYIPASIAPDGTAYYKSMTSPPDNSVAVCIKVPDRIIPVIFVPGIMGTNLAHSSEDNPVWLLNNRWTIGANWVFKDAKQRQTLLDPDETTVSQEGAIPTGTKQTEAELKRRGWGEVSHMSYGKFLVWLENALDDGESAKTGLRAELMSGAVSEDPSVQPLTYDEVATSYKYLFPVHAVGYNWLQSNVYSARRLEKKIRDFMNHYNAIKKMCEHVIIVTHSMGGLVARYHSAYIDGKESELGCVKRREPITRVLGIVHGVMPATGAAAAYTRMKAGTEGLAGFALGRTAVEMVPVFARSPGALQLLPSHDYGKEWLKIKDEEQARLFPETDNVYKEIYTKRDRWWGLCDASLINPFDKAGNSIDTDWKRFSKLIKEDVRAFHASIARKYHPNTYVFYGSDTKQKAWGDAVWRKDAVLPLNVGARKSIDDITSGTVVSNLGNDQRVVLQTVAEHPVFVAYSLYGPDEDGDGTVPSRSGRAPRGSVKVCIPYKNITHEKAFEGEVQMRFSLWAITKIAYSVKETCMAYRPK